MRVRELKEILKKYHDDMLVVLGNDCGQAWNIREENSGVFHLETGVDSAEGFIYSTWEEYYRDINDLGLEDRGESAVVLEGSGYGA